MKQRLADHRDGSKELTGSYPVDIINNIWTLEWGSIAHLELLPGCPLSSDVWTLPHDWVSWGAARRKGSRTIDFAEHLPTGWKREEKRAEDAIRRLKRIAVLLFTRTMKITKKVKSPKQPRSWVQDVKVVIRVARATLPIVGLREHTSSCPDGSAIFGSLTDKQFAKEVLAPNRSQIKRVTPRLNALLAHGEFDDWPSTDVASRSSGRIAGNTYQPFDDNFTAIFSDSAIWISEVLGPDILKCWKGIRDLREKRITTSNPPKALAERRKYMTDFPGRTTIGDAEFKYHIRLVVSTGSKFAGVIVSRWSELSPDAARQLAIKLQDAHATLLAMCMAPRNGELASLPRDCLREYMAGGIVRGYTFKLSEAEEERDWPIPSLAVTVVHQQRALAEILDPGGEKLFVSFRSEKDRQNPRDKLVLKPKAFTDSVYLPDGTQLTSLCTGSVHSHRIRKTVARLAALALVGANQILFDILGHRDPDMTLNYILADPLLQEEMQQIAKEAALAITRSAFDDVYANGGPAADAVAQLAGRLKVRSGADELDERSLVTAAALLSQNGHVTLVKKGTLCTKTWQQVGECVRSIGLPDIGNCQVTCIHRLELAAAKADHRRALDQALCEIENAGPMMRAWWQAQVLTHLMPYQDLREEMLQDERVKHALDGISEAYLQDLWSRNRRDGERLLETII